jgi:hypothetical protein
MRGGRAAKQKGSREERHLVKLFQAAGFACERIPLSGAAGGKYSGDLSIPLLGLDRTVEVKVRENGFVRLYDWLDGRDLLILRADRKEPLVVLRLSAAIEIARAAENAPRGRPVPESTAMPRCGLSAR